MAWISLGCNVLPFCFPIVVCTRSRKIGLAIDKTEASTWPNLVVCGNSFVKLIRTKALRETLLHKKMLQYPSTRLGKIQWLAKVTLLAHNSSTLLQYYILVVTLMKKLIFFVSFIYKHKRPYRELLCYMLPCVGGWWCFMDLRRCWQALSPGLLPNRVPGST